MAPSARPERLVPSRPRARRWLRLVGLLILLACAVGSIWWIDRGVMRTNVRSTPRSLAPSSPRAAPATP